MKRSLFLIPLLLFPMSSSAHPGKTDYQDGHKCLKNCEEWDLYYAEYHLHDKDRNPIRIASDRRAAARPPAVTASPPRNPEPAPAIQPVPPDAKLAGAAGMQLPKTADVPGYRAPVQEEAVFRFSDILLFLAAGVLLLSVILLRRTREKKGG
ncbi:MAG TPA: hypothetical protein VEP69_05065 [Thermodesulfovibrionales bacterium]|nr:hypothetical protein [Thermodesulfovibrionales bacterium]